MSTVVGVADAEAVGVTRLCAETVRGIKKLSASATNADMTNTSRPTLGARWCSWMCECKVLLPLCSCVFAGHDCRRYQEQNDRDDGQHSKAEKPYESHGKGSHA